MRFLLLKDMCWNQIVRVLYCVEQHDLKHVVYVVLYTSERLPLHGQRYATAGE